MGWPQPTEYNEAIQNPRSCFSDPELQAGVVVEDALGVPRPYSGNFADVYQVRGEDGRAWAVKCFTREVPALQMRYRAISDHLQGASPPFMVHFDYQPEAIRIRGCRYPALKMDWVEGFTLNEFVRRHVDRPQVMFKLAKMWVKLSLQLRRAQMAHADLQHGNVLLVPGSKTSQLSLRLIDYDGMHVPALARSPSGEVGHPNYQHPLRLAQGLYSPEVDRFPHLVIYTALRCLIVGGRELWERHDNGENLLFREADFARPQESALLLDLWQLPDPDLRRLLGHLLIGSQLPLDKVAMLDEVVGSEGRPLNLTVGQERQLQEMLPPAAARMKAAPLLAGRFSLEELIADSEDEAPEQTALRATVAVAAAPSVATRTTASAQETVRSPRRRTAIHPPPTSDPLRPSESSGVVGKPFLPWLRLPCWYCRAGKHLLESTCPHCGHQDHAALLATVVLGLACAAIASIELPHSQPGVGALLGAVAGAALMVLAPLGAFLLTQMVVGKERLHEDAWTEPSWPAAREPCPHCGRLQVVPLFVCRNCGRLAWVKLACLATAVITVLALVVLSPPHTEAPAWWMALVRGLHWAGRVAGLIGEILLVLGLFEVWKLQGRLPAEGRLRSAKARMALLLALVAPIVGGVLLVLGLFTTLQPGQRGGDNAVSSAPTLSPSDRLERGKLPGSAGGTN